jgi:predicted transcriptional regulator
MAYYKKKNETDPLSLFKRAMQWSHYQGGLPLVFIMFGFILIGAFALFSFWGNYNWVVLILGLLSVGGGLFMYFYNHESAPLNEQSKKKTENKEKILEFLHENEKIVNNDVEKLLGVSDSTATRYLDDLEEENKVEQIGKTGTAVYYILK